MNPMTQDAPEAERVVPKSPNVCPFKSLVIDEIIKRLDSAPKPPAPRKVK